MDKIEFLITVLIVINMLTLLLVAKMNHDSIKREDKVCCGGEDKPNKKSILKKIFPEKKFKAYSPSRDANRDMTGENESYFDAVTKTDINHLL